MKRNGAKPISTHPRIVKKGTSKNLINESPTTMIVKDVRRYERMVLSTANFVRHIARESLNWVSFGIFDKDKIIQ